MIYHIIETIEYEQMKNQQVYQPLSLVKEGFIHCSGNKQDILDVANYLFKNKDVLILEIDDEKLNALIRWEKAPGDRIDRTFPHIYGELKTKYITGMRIFVKDDQNNFIDWKSTEI
ncbi:hypothetical protein SOV_33590 [Sporomusa ovata DSM 2662]|uniref:DUF952 domain-containing protein n=1 Tax=Sporomusa ovata TaxID=2378 RepID=A0A0U1L2F0_9FIRM|nr:DUF952 domain-containing protein [Sporomusa ovata]EQB25294.1 hypothetical protein SOV_5c04620 [Sporomusa ovata DSM 2662]CQR73857.1 hypothetical protein SpAn4DRAFT_0319 [Sporomusa ovata]